jgi:hypothetical protein
MKNLISKLIFIFFFGLIILTLILTTTGLETRKFNTIIKKNINIYNSNINLNLNEIKFKLDIKQVSLFLESSNVKINYHNFKIPTKTLKVYVDFVSIIKSKPKIKKVILDVNELDINQLKKMSLIFKPSNLNSFVKNKITQGKLKMELEIYFTNENLLENFIARGTVTNLKANLKNKINLDKTNFSFFADKADILIQNIFAETGPIKIINGDMKLRISNGIMLDSNFKTSLLYAGKFKEYMELIKDSEYTKNLEYLEADLNNNFSINFDETYKVKNYNYQSAGKIIKANFNFQNPLDNFLLNEKINKFSLANTNIKTIVTPKKNSIDASGKYSLNKSNFLMFSLNNIFDNKLLNLKLNIDYDKLIDLKVINYNKPKNIISNISINLEKKGKNTKIKELNYTDGSNKILAEDIILNEGKFSSLKNISVQTNKEDKKNNNFSISFGKIISIKGNLLDANNLIQFIDNNNNNNIFSKINKKIEINLNNVIAPLSENLKNFNLIGKIENGKFVKISSKGDFGQNNFLDIKMKEDKKNKKKYLEIYSDLPGPILTEYDFFKGLTGGKLLYTSIINKENTISKLIIENFKVINAPGLVKLLSLADLGGLADLSEGEGLSFDTLEINMSSFNNNKKFNEILALGPSISILMEGYQNSNIISLRGSLVPAKTLNKLISKIPLIGEIVIPKELGEGLFGISFKMKGPPGKIKTSINPIRTVTPRFIQKIIDKKKIK